MIIRTRHWALLAVWVLISSCAVSPTGRTQFIIISPDAAIIESEAAYMDTVRQLDDEDKLVGDPLTVARVARITGRLVSIAVADFPESADWKWSVAIVDDTETVNAWCMAGGRMAVYTGLFDVAYNQDQLATVMAHEVGHVLAKHGNERASRSALRRVGIAAARVLGASKNTVQAIDFGTELGLQLPFDRAQESEALADAQFGTQP